MVVRQHVRLTNQTLCNGEAVSTSKHCTDSWSNHWHVKLHRQNVPNAHIILTDIDTERRLTVRDIFQPTQTMHTSIRLTDTDAHASINSDELTYEHVHTQGHMHTLNQSVTGRYAGWETDRQTGRMRDKQTDRQAERQADRQAERQGRQTGRMMYRQTRGGKSFTLAPGQHPAISRQSKRELRSTCNLLNLPATQEVHPCRNRLGCGVAKTKFPIVSITAGPHGWPIRGNTHCVVETTSNLPGQTTNEWEPSSLFPQQKFFLNGNVVGILNKITSLAAFRQ